MTAHESAIQWPRQDEIVALEMRSHPAAILLRRWLPSAAQQAPHGPAIRLNANH